MSRIIIKLLLSGLLLFSISEVVGQIEGDYYDSLETEERDIEYRSHREVGFNMTQLIDIIIPFKQGSTFPGPFAVIWRKGKNHKYFNFQMGARINSNNIEDDNFVNLQVGFLKKHTINKKLKYYTSKNVLMTDGSTILEMSSIFDDDIKFGLTFAGGFEYSITKNLSLVTETTLAIVVTGRDPGFSFLPPVGVYLLGRF